MFKGLIKKIKNFQEKRAILRERRLRAMYFEIRGAVIKFYENNNKQGEDDNIDLPPFVKADMAMKNYIKTDKDIIFYYKKGLKYGVCERV